ncbi:HEAT repeat domain-containing protein [Natronobacterium texcoconense]|uniref:HEAT repeat n=1 Tax=Natronobacterium texcoconense TaxID=1095778 RepID=A0A1H1IVB6_NATTX|nr:HEAT repeat domain-containing protein [Natronobacterium texcoconense]SDR41644.1 HEAT repeat [Natronobacterium texcoconense]
MQDGDTAYLYELARDSREQELLEYLTEANDPVVRYRAAELLGGLETGTSPELEERIGAALLRAVRTDDRNEVRAAAINAMYLREEGYLDRLLAEVTAAGPDGTPEWMGVDRTADWLDTDYPEFRLIAATALGRIGSDAATDALVGVIGDPDVRVRTKALGACARIGDPSCIDAVASRLDDPQRRVRRTAVMSLASIGTERSIQALASAARSGSEDVRAIAIGSLDQFGSPAPLPLLLDGLEDRSEQVRRTAARTLLELLANAPSDRSHEVRHEIAERICDAAPPNLPSELLAILDENQPQYVRRNATWLLGHVAEHGVELPDESVDYLVEALDDPDEITAEFALSTLAELDDSGLVDRLEAFVDRDDLSGAAKSRAEFVLRKQTTRGPSRKAVVDSVEYTYVAEPFDYTAKKRGQGAGSWIESTE